MKYLMDITIANPDTPKGMSSDLLYKIDVTFIHDPDQYGNGYFVILNARKNPFRNIYDLRYNADFDPTQKPKWLEKWAHTYWSGKDDTYIVKSLAITKVK